MRCERGTHPHVPERAGVDRVAAPAFLQEPPDRLVAHLGEGVCVVRMRYSLRILIICDLLTRLRAWVTWLGNSLSERTPSSNAQLPRDRRRCGRAGSSRKLGGQSTIAARVYSSARNSEPEFMIKKQTTNQVAAAPHRSHQHGPKKPYVHYSNPGAIASIAASSQLWGKGTGRHPLGALSARAYDGPHVPSKVTLGRMHAVDFTTDVHPPRSAPSVGGRVWLWPDGTPGTATVTLPSGDDVVIVPIDVVGVAP